MEVIEPGAEVTIGDDISGKVLAVCIRDTSVTYECVWWSGRTRNTAWFAEHEVEAGDAKMKIGFK